MKCPYCGYSESKVVDSRSSEDNTKIRRRRECLKCEKRFTTYEAVDYLPFIVIKKDGTREEYSREKLLRGMIRSCEKRPVSTATLENAVMEIEQSLQNNCEREISSSEIGELCMEKLKKIDQVAYVRFASVYRQFEDINTFMQEIKSLIKPE